MDLARLGRKPASQRRIRLTLQWLVFKDQWGNFVMVDPAENKPMWLDEERRPPTVYLAATDAEVHAATEAMLERYVRTTKVTPQHRELVDKVEALFEEKFNNRRERAKRAA